MYLSFTKYWAILTSMSRKGNCWDNAVAESFFKTIKTELIYQNHFLTRKQAELAIFEYIETFYNGKLGINFGLNQSFVPQIV